MRKIIENIGITKIINEIKILIIIVHIRKKSKVIDVWNGVQDKPKHEYEKISKCMRIFD